MPLATGTRIGVYQVVAPLGAGGMGEVYRARDTQLDRHVALKILPQSVASDPDRLMRFDREARTLASLNHPHIAQIYGLEQSNGVSALVMELVEGEDLAARLTRGPLPLDEALPIARQIAEALETAHESGIVHRDLKPANVKLRSDGTIKVLDFGLAKASSTASDAAAAIGATVTSPAMTMHGVILGTAAYMSPEQAKGRPVDKRADVWAFGCVLYEMLTGQRAFAGEDITDTIAAVVTRDPDWARLPANTPASVVTLLHRCLEKPLQKRLPHIGVARLDLEPAPAPTASAAAAPVPRSAGGRGVMWLAVPAALAIGIVGGAWWMSMRRSASPEPFPYHASILLPPEQNLQTLPPTSRFAISPDGRQLAYAGTSARGDHLFVRSLDQLSARSLATAQMRGSPFWSPDSRWVAYFGDGQLLKVDVTGGSPTVLAESPAFRQQPQPGTWNGDDVIIVPNGATLARVSARGGELQPLTALDPATKEQWHTFPHFLPDGRHFLYTAYVGLTATAVYASSIDRPGHRTKIMDGGSNVQYAAGRLLYVRNNTLVAQPFDVSTQTLSGEPSPVADGILPNIAIHYGGAFSVSPTGALIHQSTSPETGVNRTGDRLVWRTRRGEEQVLVDVPDGYRHLAISPNGRQALVSKLEDRGRSDLWVIDLMRGVQTRVTFNARENVGVWMPGGNEVVFNSAKDGQLDLYRKRLAAAGADELLLGDAQPKAPTSVSPDGRHFLFESVSAESGIDLWVAPLDGSARPTPFLNSPYQERWGHFSPDGRWVAYMSDESGERQIYVRTFPAAGQQLQISSNGGEYPRWSRDGKELFFYSSGRMMAAAVRTSEGRLEVSGVTPLFECRPPEGFSRMFYDVAPDGRFLLMAGSGAPTLTRLTLITNWPQLLREPR